MPTGFFFVPDLYPTLLAGQSPVALAIFRGFQQTAVSTLQDGDYASPEPHPRVRVIPPREGIFPQTQEMRNELESG